MIKWQKHFAQLDGIRHYSPILIEGLWPQILPELEVLFDKLAIAKSDRVIVQESPIKIETVRALNKQALMSPLAGERKVIVVANCNTMTDEAQNAFLKTLEEPSASTLVVLTTSQTQGVLPTILSRVQRYQHKGESAGVDAQIAPLFEGSLGDRLMYVSKQAKKIENGEMYLDSLLQYVKEQSPTPSQKSINLLNKIYQGKKQLKANVHLELILVKIVL